MHPYIYQLTQESIQADRDRYHENERWVRELPRRTPRYRVLTGAVMARLITLAQTITRKSGAKREQLPHIESGRVAASTEL